ncbi:glycosyltransferase family 4 protein [Reichenbachiella sp.]|uniref:glycosyltransferase family 4 protein n=1 Tax=Reichenbachiella sp. TaxID=2184521 RepID=UPI003BB05888
MRIAITINTSWNIYNFRLGLIRAFINQGHDVVAIAPYDEYSNKLEEVGCEYVPITMDNTGSNPFKDFALLRQLKKVYQHVMPDVILHYTVKPNIYGTLAAHSLNIPVINNVSGLGTVFLSKSVASFAAKKLYKRAFKNAQVVFFQNSDDREVFISEIDLPNLSSDLLPGSGINLSQFQPNPIPSQEHKTFLMISRVIIDKGVIEFIEAAKLVKKKYPHTSFQLLGKLDTNHVRGIPYETISDAADSAVLEYLGETDDVRPFIQNAHCVVLPSYREGTPRTLLEAAALGKPIVTTDVPGCREVVENGENGYLCEVKSSSDLSKKMITICEKSDNDLQIMGDKSRMLAESKFDEQIVISQYLKHLSNIMNQIPNE